MAVLITIFLLAIIGGFGIAKSAEWGADVGEGLGKTHMKDLGMDDETKEYHE